VIGSIILVKIEVVVIGGGGEEEEKKKWKKYEQSKWKVLQILF
tara:strand:+ start:359 stop:487 length:129 start_codon:yes stop_codon:yes gene_type:complete